MSKAIKQLFTLHASRVVAKNSPLWQALNRRLIRKDESLNEFGFNPLKEENKCRY